MKEDIMTGITEKNMEIPTLSGLDLSGPGKYPGTEHNTGIILLEETVFRVPEDGPIVVSDARQTGKFMLAVFVNNYTSIWKYKDFLKKNK